MGFKLIAGRNFIKGAPSDSSAVILNEAAVKALDIQTDPIGKVLNDGLRVIGVVEDFHTESLRSEIAPLVIIITNTKFSKQLYDELSVKMRSGVPIESSIAYLEREWKQITQEAFECHPLSGNFQTMLAKERTLAQIISFFTGLAVFISCLGLFALSTLLIISKTREIGIRKVMGATIANILLLVNKEFLKPVIFAIAIGAAAAYYSMENWLGNFAYHEELSLQYFVWASAIALATGVITVSYHSIKASVANPVKALKED
jgi:putative ABC transport system permease protein